MAMHRDRKTKETNVSVDFDFGIEPSISVSTGVPFFDHMLTSMAFHGGMVCTIRASGDLEVDPHHLVEDVGIVLGGCIGDYVEASGPIGRFGSSIVPMDDALSEVTVDVSGRAYLVYDVVYPQHRVGTLDIHLFREFLQGFVTNGRLNLHAHCRYGLNSHHMAESLFKALGRSLAIACEPVGGEIRSTKGRL